MRLYVPRLLGDAEADPAGEAPERVEPHANGEIMLCMESHDAVHEVVAAVLTDQGYSVFSESDGAGLQKLLESGPKGNLLLTDAGLPAGMDRRQLVNAARLARPHLQVLSVTGTLKMTSLDAEISNTEWP